jgi:hypothetical protein
MSGRSAKDGAQPHAESGGATGCQSHQDEGWDSLESVNSLVWSQGSILDDRLHYDYYMHDYGKILEDTGRYWKILEDTGSLGLAVSWKFCPD